MTTHYRLYAKKNDPSINLTIPSNMLADLEKTATENGRELNTEFLVRIARTLKNLSDNFDENQFLSYLFSGDHDDELFFAS